MSRYIAIMAGGVGSRFWPSSTEDKPKQFLDILGVGKSLLRITYERALRIVPNDHILIVTNKRYKDLVKNQLPELPSANILCEPSMNNTAPCICYAALHVRAQDPNASMSVLPSDHVILKEDAFVDIMNTAYDAVETNDMIMTLGISPTRPDTGYGYIQYEASGDNEVSKVKEFREKPDLATAQAYISTGKYLWNAGMFVWTIEGLLEAFAKYSPQILEVLGSNMSAYGSADEQNYIDQVYPSTENISIDYAILERADNVYTIPADIGWSDLGTWNSLHSYMSDDSDQVTIGKNIHLIDSKNIIVMSNNEKKIVIKGLENYIVVDEDNALLIYPKSEEQEIKDVVKKLG